jgi:type IV pilus assembly protein PilY1
MKTFNLALAGAVALALTGLVSTSAFAGATITHTNGLVALGVNDEGHLNTSDGNVAVNSSRTGLAYKFADDGQFFDATSPGCFCEGWGVSVNGTDSGFANVSADSGANNLTVGSFASTATTATSAVSLTSLPGLKVTQAYTPSVSNTTGALFKNRVTITNDTLAAVNDVKYARVMDWDVPRTEFNEFVTIKGTATTTELEKSHNNGFNTANPLADYGEMFPGGTTDVDFTDVGPKDHGAYFRFNFGTLAVGESKVFDVYYGAAGSEADALSLLGLVTSGIELYSFGQSNGNQLTGVPATFIFAFDGVGGSNVIPEPMTLALMGLGFAGIGAARRRK